MGIFLGVAKISNIFSDAWNSWYFLGVNGRCWAQPYVWRKNVLPTPHHSWTRNHFYLTSIGFFKESKRLVALAGWLTEWLRSKQTDSYILLHTALKTLVSFRGAGGGVVLWYYHIYISRFSPFWEVQNFEFQIIFLGGGGGGGGGEIEKWICLGVWWNYE